MSNLDPLSLLDEQVGGGFMPAHGEMHHKKDAAEDLDHLALAVLGTNKPIPPKIANTLAKERLLKRKQNPYARPASQQRPVTAQGVEYFDDDPFIPDSYQPTNQLVIDLEAKIAFLQEKLEMCEKYLSPEAKKDFKIDWMLKVVDAAGDDLMTAAGKGFKKLHEPPPRPELPLPELPEPIAVDPAELPDILQMPLSDQELEEDNVAILDEPLPPKPVFRKETQNPARENG